MNKVRKDANYRKPHSITDSITIFLREAILSGRLKPGRKINETEIAERLSVSRSPLREALRTVAKEGLVKISPRKGAVVSEISEKELKEIFEVREMIEFFALDLIEKHDVTDFQEMAESLDFRADEAVELDEGEYLRWVTGFHLALVKTAGNTKLYQFYRVLSNSLIRYQRIAATIPQRMDLSVREHKKILEALTRRRFDRARDLLREHLSALELKIFRECGLSAPEGSRGKEETS